MKNIERCGKAGTVVIALLLAPLAAVDSACTSNVITTPPASGGAHQDGAGTGEAIPSSAPGVTVKVGGTVGVAPGAQVGYALTAPALESYHFRWTGDAAVVADGYHEFYGSVWTQGHFTSLTPGCANGDCPLEQGDFVSNVEQVTGGERIDWDTFALDGWDGFSFTTDSEPVYFDVYVDGSRHPELVQFPSGMGNLHPATSPFAASTAK